MHKRFREISVVMTCAYQNLLLVKATLINVKFKSQYF